MRQVMGWNDIFVFAFARKNLQNNMNFFGINFCKNGNLAKTVETCAKTENIWKCFANIVNCIVNFANLFLKTSLRKQNFSEFLPYITHLRDYSQFAKAIFVSTVRKYESESKGNWEGGPPRTECKCLHSHLNEYQLVNMVATRGDGWVSHTQTQSHSMLQSFHDDSRDTFLGATALQR